MKKKRIRKSRRVARRPRRAPARKRRPLPRKKKTVRRPAIKRPAFKRSKKKPLPRPKKKKRSSPARVPSKKKIKPAPSRWISTRAWLDRIDREYDIPRRLMNKPDDFLAWHDTQSEFLWVSRRFPPYGGAGFYVKITQWFVVYNENEDEHYLWCWQRVNDNVRRRKMTDGVEWEDVVKEWIPGIREDIEKWILGKDYLQLREFVGWSAYPLADWVKRWEKRKARGKQ